MIIKILALNKKDDSLLAAFNKEFEKRISRYIKLEIINIPPPKHSAKLSVSEIQAAEDELILQRLAPEDTVVLLDKTGTQLASEEFAEFMQNKMTRGATGLTFIIGGAYGFGERLYGRADHRLSMSKFTFPHQLAKSIFLEQLYRAFTILRNEKYHHS